MTLVSFAFNELNFLFLSSVSDPSDSDDEYRGPEESLSFPDDSSDSDEEDDDET